MSEKPTIYLERAIYRSEKVVLVRFIYNRFLISAVKRIPGAWWNKELNCWLISSESFRFTDIKKVIGQYARIDVSGLHRTPSEVNPGNRIGNPVKSSPAKLNELPAGYLETLQTKKYSESTIKTYTKYFTDFQQAFRGKDMESINTADINEYILKLIKEKDISHSQQNQRINAIKFFYEKVLGREKEYYRVLRPRKENKLPTVLSLDEVRRLLDSTSNIKHKAILMTIYSGGLRRSELIRLRVEDIDSDRKLIKIRGSKGKKDRYTILSDKLLLHLRTYYTRYRPKEWLFEGQNGGSYSPASIEKIFKHAVLASGIRKYVTPHSLRHSFATHLLEQGINLRYIQELLGHNSSKTTEIYTHVARNNIGKIRNPLDDL